MKRQFDPVPEITKLAEAVWLQGMREHFAQTGHYRSQDIRRVLGNPWDRVELATKEDAEFSSKVVA